MKEIKLLRWAVICAAISCGCTINISPPGPTGDLPQASGLPSPGVQSPAGWKNLKLNGRLIYTSGKVDTSQGTVFLALSVQALDLATGSITTIFSAPQGAWIDAATVSPDEQQLVVSYRSPRDSGQSGLYVMPLDGSQRPQLLFVPPSDNDRYYQPGWSPDGKYVYFSHTNYQGSTTYEVMRMAYPDGKPERVADQAYWPSVSKDGAHLTYVSIDPASGANGLYLANSDGTQYRPVPVSGPWAREIIDAPTFMPDGQSVLFSAPTWQESSAPHWMDKVLGISVAYAHSSVPSEWWSVPLAGGKPVELTHVRLYGLFASFSPDGEYIASFSTDGIFVMKPDGTGLTKVVDYVGGILGTVDWTH
jgi:Tol biopolymer transport system component